MTGLTRAAAADRVCSLNPHGGEGGLFGVEEQRIIRPAVEQGLAEGLRLDGPFPADTLMVRARTASLTPWWPCITTRDTSP